MRPVILFSIILKVLGLFVLKDLLVALPGLLTGLSFIMENDFNLSTSFVIAQVLTFFIYFGLIYVLLFRTRWVTEQLKLTKEFGDEPLNFPINPATVLTIAVMIIGGLIVIDIIPIVVNQFLQYLHRRQAPMGIQNNGLQDVFIALLKLIIGLLLLTNTRQVVQFIERRRKKRKTET